MKKIPKIQSRSAFAAFSFALLTSASSLSAQLVAFENFDYTGGSDLVGGNGGTGWTGAWTSVSGPSFEMGAADSSLHFGQTPEFIDDGTSHISFLNGGTSPVVERDFAGISVGGTGTLYTSMLFRLSNEDSLSGFDARFRLQFYSGANMRGNVGIGSEGTLFVNGNQGGYSAATSDTAVNAAAEDTTYLLVMRRDTVGISASVFEAGQNIAEPVSWDVSHSLASGVTLSTVRLYAQGLGQDDILLDDLRIGTEWGDVVVVPEPGTYALFGGLLALGFVATRRRK